MNTPVLIETWFRRLAPPVTAILLIIAFVLLGLWQLDRAAEKVAVQQLFDSDADYVALVDDMKPREFQRIRATGRFISDRQFLLDNMIVNSRVGYYVIAAFQYAPDKPLLIVNRGWIAATPDHSVRPEIPATDVVASIRGRVGYLPRVGIRSGEVFADADGWPRLANYPQLSDLSAALGRDLLPFVLLLDPDDSQPLVRQWQPHTQGPMMHYGYAFQWFAMAAAVCGILLWKIRKRRDDAAS